MRIKTVEYELCGGDELESCILAAARYVREAGCRARFTHNSRKVDVSITDGHLVVVMDGDVYSVVDL